jgi:RRXRR protein
MSYVLVINQERQPCAPVPPGRARFLLTAKRAAVWRRYPFTIVLKEGAAPDEPVPLRLKLDPGSKNTGLAAVNDTTGQVVWAAELTHRGQRVKERLDHRRACRRSRRSRHTRYRPARYCQPLHRGDGYSYAIQKRATALPPQA